MVIKCRAISNEQKEERRQEILKTALDLFMKKKYNSISIAEIAKKTGIAKGTIFLYFRTKEEIFVELQTQLYREWFSEINKKLIEAKKVNKAYEINEFVKLILNSLLKYPLLIRMIPILHVILEQNIDFDTTLNFKKFLLNNITTTGALFEDHLPFLNKGEGALLLFYIQALVLGLQQMAEPSDIVKQVIALPEMEIFNISFEEYFFNALRDIINGLKIHNTI